jgi:hypothetical protein
MTHCTTVELEAVGAADQTELTTRRERRTPISKET